MLRVSMSNWLSVKSIAVLLPSASLCSNDTSLTTTTSDDDEEAVEEDDDDAADAPVAGGPGQRKLADLMCDDDEDEGSI